MSSLRETARETASNGDHNLLARSDREKTGGCFPCAWTLPIKNGISPTMDFGGSNRQTHFPVGILGASWCFPRLRSSAFKTRARSIRHGNRWPGLKRFFEGPIESEPLGRGFLGCPLWQQRETLENSGSLAPFLRFPRCFVGGCPT